MHHEREAFEAERLDEFREHAGVILGTIAEAFWALGEPEAQVIEGDDPTQEALGVGWRDGDGLGVSSEISTRKRSRGTVFTQPGQNSTRADPTSARACAVSPAERPAMRCFSASASRRFVTAPRALMLAETRSPSCCGSLALACTLVGSSIVPVGRTVVSAPSLSRAACANSSRVT